MLAQTVIKKPVCLRAPARQKIKRQQKKNTPSKRSSKSPTFSLPDHHYESGAKLGRVSKAKKE